MGDVDRHANVCEVEAVAQSDQGQSDNMVHNQLLEILAWLLKL